MPFIPTSQEWLTQSALLLEARPTTARVTTKYNIKPAKIRKAEKDAAAAAAAANDNNNDTAAASAKPPRATLILKTYDPDSGVCLKYKTTKAAEVSRLVQLLGSLGRKMAALPDAPAPAAAVEEEAVVAVPAAAAPGAGAGAGAGAATPPAAGQSAQQGQGGGGGGGKGKKKKGKR